MNRHCVRVSRRNRMSETDIVCIDMGRNYHRRMDSKCRNDHNFSTWLGHDRRVTTLSEILRKDICCTIYRCVAKRIDITKNS